jgi:hypothetical protein
VAPLRLGESAMPVENMRPELQMVYKNSVDNLAGMKKQQWIITAYAIALFAGIGGLAHSQPKLAEPAVDTLARPRGRRLGFFENPCPTVPPDLSRPRALQL